MYQQTFDRLGKFNAIATEWKTSALEKHGTALFLKQSLPLSPLAAPTKREICNIHTSDMSGHVTLSFTDAQEVIDKGWGERHRLSGTDWNPFRVRDGICAQIVERPISFAEYSKPVSTLCEVDKIGA
jgi:hypothetical protein